MNDYYEKYRTYCHLGDDITDGNIYYNMLQREDRRLLFPAGVQLSERERDVRKQLLYLYLWDTLFYGKYEYDENCIWRDDDHRNECIRKIKDRLLSKTELDENVKKVLFEIVSHWSELRNLIYSEEKEYLDHCQTIEDFKTFLSKYPNAYREYFLYANYRYCELAHQAFLFSNEVLCDFPNSTLFDVDKVRRKCICLGGHYVLFSDEVLANHSLEDCLASLLRNLTKKIVCDNNVFFVASPIKVKQYVNIMQPEQFNCINSILVDNDEFYFGTYDELNAFAETLSFLSGIKFEIPKFYQVDSALITIDFDDIKNCSEDVGVWCIDDDFNALIKYSNGQLMFDVPKDYYAMFMLVMSK